MFLGFRSYPSSIPQKTEDARENNKRIYETNNNALTKSGDIRSMFRVLPSIAQYCNRYMLKNRLMFQEVRIQQKSIGTILS